MEVTRMRERGGQGGKEGYKGGRKKKKSRNEGQRSQWDGNGEKKKRSGLFY